MKKKVCGRVVVFSKFSVFEKRGSFQMLHLDDTLGLHSVFHKANATYSDNLFLNRKSSLKM